MTSLTRLAALFVAGPWLLAVLAGGSGPGDALLQEEARRKLLHESSDDAESSLENSRSTDEDEEADSSLENSRSTDEDEEAWSAGGNSLRQRGLRTVVCQKIYGCNGTCCKTPFKDVDDCKCKFIGTTNCSRRSLLDSDEKLARLNSLRDAESSSASRRSLNTLNEAKEECKQSIRDETANLERKLGNNCKKKCKRACKRARRRNKCYAKCKKKRC